MNDKLIGKQKNIDFRHMYLVGKLCFVAYWNITGGTKY